MKKAPGSISFTVKTVRFFGITAGLAIAAAAIVSLPLAAGILAWHGLSYVTYAYLDFNELPGLIQGWLMAIGVNTLWVPPAPEFLIVWRYSVWVMIGFACLLLMQNALTPMRYRLKRIAGASVTKLEKSSEYNHYVNDILRKRDGGPRVNVWTVPLPGITAFALSSPLGNNVIVLSNGAITAFPPDVMRWVLAHEYAHLRNGDTKSSTFWLMAIQGLLVFDRLRHWLMRLFIRVFYELPVLRYFVAPLSWAFLIFSYAGRIGYRSGIFVFTLFDRWSSRQMEFAADKYAAYAETPEPGVRLFTALSGDFEPTFNSVFATHPTNAERIRALNKLAAQTTK